MDNFEVLTTEDRQQVAYAMCIGGSVLLGAAVGRLGALPGLAAGAAVGLLIGLATCRKLAPAIQRKLLSHSDALSESEVLAVLRVLRDDAGVATKHDAMYLLGRARVAAAGPAAQCRSQMTAAPLRVSAGEVLAQRA